MGNNINNFMNSQQGKKLASRKNDVEQLASSKDGQQVKKLLEGRDLESAFKNGDTDTLQSALTDILKNDSGARIISQLQKIIEES